jgi:hypothetical protein
MTNNLSKLSEYVDRGAKLLDSKYPDWFKKIDFFKLSMDHCARCILGQTFGDYVKGLKSLWPGCNINEDFRYAFDYGFDVCLEDRQGYGDSQIAWDELRRLWVHQIHERLDKDNCTKRFHSAREVMEHYIPNYPPEPIREEIYDYAMSDQ